MIEPGTRVEFICDGHDAAASLNPASNWRTPSGQPLREGGRYVKELRLRFRTVRICGRPGHAMWSLLRYKPGWEVVSEELPAV